MYAIETTVAEGLASAGLPPPLVDALMGTFGRLVDPAARVFLPSLVVAALVAWAVGRRRSGTFATFATVATFARQSATSRVDLGLFLFNGLGAALLVVPWGISITRVAMATVIFLDDHFPVPLWTEGLGDRWVVLLYSITLFLAWDLSRYLVHRALHAVPWLWSFHQVHHSADALSPLTLYRVHPVERALFIGRGLIVTGVVAGVFFFLFQARAVEAEILGVSAVGFLFNLLGGNLRHSHVWLRYGAFEKWFISPAQHQMHHSRDAELQQSNYGTWLAVWDRIWGSLVVSEETPPERFGLAEGDKNHRPDSVLSALFRPVRFWR